MPLYQSPAAAIRSIKLGEADRLVTFFTRDFGKIKAAAKGAARPKSKFGGRLEPFNVVDMIAFGKEKSDIFRLNSCDIMERFPALGEDLSTLTKALACAELVDLAQTDRDPNTSGFHLLVSAWRALASERSGEKQDLLLRIFELKFLESAGYKPALDRCASCGGMISSKGAAFSARKGGLLCHKCLHVDSSAPRITAGAAALMKKSLEIPIEKCGRLAAGKAPLAEMEAALSEFIRVHIRRERKTERFLARPL